MRRLCRYCSETLVELELLVLLVIANSLLVCLKNSSRWPLSKCYIIEIIYQQYCSFLFLGTVWIWPTSSIIIRRFFYWSLIFQTLEGSRKPIFIQILFNQVNKVILFLFLMIFRWLGLAMWLGVLLPTPNFTPSYLSPWGFSLLHTIKRFYRNI